MKCQDYYCLLLGMTSCDLDAKTSVCRPQAAVVQQCQSVAAGPAGSATQRSNPLGGPGWASEPSLRPTICTQMSQRDPFVFRFNIALPVSQKNINFAMQVWAIAVVVLVPPEILRSYHFFHLNSS